MTDWHNHWNITPGHFRETDFLCQVGKTVKGVPISAEQFKQIIMQLKKELHFIPSDIVLDLCCGNGLITHEVAHFCKTVIGVDYSVPLIEVAKKYHQPINVNYIQTSVLHLTPEELNGKTGFTKVYMYEALQHFEEKDLLTILRIIKSVSERNVMIYFGSVPDKDCIWSFYNTPERRKEYSERKKERRAAIGTWWDRRVIESVASSEGYSCIFVAQHPSLHTSHYRFDVKIIKERG